ncbi:MAG: hypothetical protein JO102_05370 [Elusimicrobia bacterium]|nr:hypothetical protein [Elusimicrobiota bacterium]
MMKAILGVLVGAVVYFVWGALSWTVIPWHNAAMKSIPEERLVSDTLKVVIKEKGLYFFPSHPAGSAEDEKAWKERYTQGPVGMLVFSPAGREPMGPSMFGFAILGALLMSSLLMWIFWASRLARAVHLIHLGAAVGLIAGLATHLAYWNWFGFPGAWTAVGIADLVIAFALTGAALCPFVPRRENRNS